MVEQLTAWVLKAMVVAWLSVGSMVGVTPKNIASAIAIASNEKPLEFEGDENVRRRRTAALMTAIGVFESGFKQIAGDCRDKPPGWPGCGKEEGSQPTSFCFLQVHFIDGVDRVKGYTPEELMRDPLACARAGREIMRDSIAAHKKRLKDDPSDAVTEPLLHYAGTGPQARRRFELAVKLFKTVEWPYRCDE